MPELSLIILVALKWPHFFSMKSLAQYPTMTLILIGLSSIQLSNITSSSLESKNEGDHKVLTNFLLYISMFSENQSHYISYYQCCYKCNKILRYSLCKYFLYKNRKKQTKKYLRNWQLSFCIVLQATMPIEFTKIFHEHKINVYYF